MAKHVFKKNQTETVEVTESDSQWVLRKGATLSGEYGFHSSDFDDVSFDVSGRIKASVYGISAQGFDVGERADNVDIDISASGSVEANLRAINIQGNTASIENRGRIRSGEDSAVVVDGDDGSVRNFGKIIADAGAAIQLDGGSFQVENNGLIRGAGSAISIWAEESSSVHNAAGGVIDGVMTLHAENSMAEMTFVNKGKLVGVAAEGLGTIAATLGDGRDHVVNRGAITGDLYLNGGADEADLRHGKLKNGVVRGGEGNDVFIIDNAKTRIFEAGSEGKDTIKTTVSFTLGSSDGDSFETVTAIGKKNIDLTGNGMDNNLVGNDRRNVLTGGEGDDLLRGGAGADSLWGGAGADDFDFSSGHGKDVIHDFKPEESDRIVLHLIPGIKEFDDLDTRMTTNSDGDTIIDLGGGNQIKLIDVAKDDLRASDFHIITEIVIDPF